MEKDAPVIMVACDESGNDGENLFGGNSTVFAHGSTSLSTEDADELIAGLRLRTKTQSAELKSKDLLKEKNLDSALWMLRHPAVSGRSLVHLTEKRYFLTCKLFDSTVEEQMSASGIDILDHRHDPAVFATETSIHIVAGSGSNARHARILPVITDWRRRFA